MSDRRANRSRRALWEALFALMQDHDWNDINVQMICARADVARSTFYAHFPTKQDLLDSGFALGLEQIEQIARSMDHKAELPTVSWLVAHLASSQGFRRHLQGSAAGHGIMLRFRAMSTDLIRSDLHRLGWTTTDDNLTFVIGGVFARIEAWLATGCPEPQTTLAANLRRQIAAVVQ